ncbi:monocarboxylate transporter 12 [Anoplophora glabripennis]|nr:monocarboxylate transporter 12 [Anoplophora glabripennis]XP_018570451.1 monocarboxylate transporter 12 [Anoplophora glabripennis]
MAESNVDTDRQSPATPKNFDRVNQTPKNSASYRDAGAVLLQNGDLAKRREESPFVSRDDKSTSKITSPKKSPARNNLELLLNEKNAKKKLRINSLYENSVDSESETLLKKNLINSNKDDEDKPVLHVQFDSDNKSDSSIAKEPCPSPSSISSSSSSSSSSSESLEISEARPPDGGWGWVVVLASFVVNLIADGITFSFGVIFVEFLKYFGENRGTTAWIGGLFMAMPLLSGPIASFLTDRYGCRKVTIFGAILASVGFIISSRANSMTVLCITFGIVAGFGLSLCYVASVVIVAYYFDKKRSFATGLAVCGSGIGTFIFAPLIQLLLDEYGWRGTTLILAGLFLNLVVCGALMRDLPWTSEKQKSLAKERKRTRNMKRKNKGSSADSFSVSNSTNTASVLQPIMESHKEDETEELSDRLCSSLVNLPTYLKNGEKIPLEVLELLATHKNVYNMLLVNYPSLLAPSRSFSDPSKLHESHMSSKHAHTQLQLSSPNNVTPQNPQEGYLWLNNNQLETSRGHHHKKVPPAYLRDLRIHRLSVTYRGAMLNINRYRLRASSCPDIYRNSMTTIAKEKVQWYAGLWDFWDLLVDMFDFSHFADPKFFVFAVSNFLLYTWYDVPYVYLTDYAINNGVTKDAASILISIIGIINMIGEIILGWAGDRAWANASVIYAACMGLCGGIIALVPLITDYKLLSAVSGAFGFFIAANYSLTCIILVELITLDRFTNAYGLLLLVQGLANLIGPPLGGWLYDITGTYDLPFYLAGLFIAISGLMLIVLPLAKRYKRFVQRQASSEAPIEEDSPKEPKLNSYFDPIKVNDEDPEVDNSSRI